MQLAADDSSYHANLQLSSFLHSSPIRPSAIKNSSYNKNIKAFSSLAKEEKIPFSILVALYTGTDKERLIPIIWDQDKCLFTRDNGKEIEYKGSNCVIDETKDNELAVKLITKYLVSEAVCVCDLGQGV
jgi:hypothetical protein